MESVLSGKEAAAPAKKLVGSTGSGSLGFASTGPARISAFNQTGKLIWEAHNEKRLNIRITNETTNFQN